MNFSDPRMMALLSAGGALLQSSGASPRPISMAEGLGNAIPAGIQGAQTAQGFQMQEMLQKKAHDEAMQKIQAQEFLQKHQEQGTDPRTLIQQAAMSANPFLMQMAGNMAKALPTVKFTKEGLDAQGNPTLHNIMSTGEVMPTGVTPLERLMQVNEGNQITLRGQNTGQVKGSPIGVGINPGQAASLAQSARHHADSMGMQAANLGVSQQRLAMDRRGMVQPKFQDGAFVYPPTEDNPEGRIVKTDMYVPPKGSSAAQQSSAGKVNGLLDEAEKYIGGATGSMVGNVADKAAGALGVSLPGAQNIARLKTLEAGLVMGMPRLEGPQSNLDQQLYREAAGNIGDPSVPAATKKAAIDTIRRIQNTYPGAFGKSGGTAAASDGWGELR